jgi:hypothetical protein
MKPKTHQVCVMAVVWLLGCSAMLLASPPQVEVKQEASHWYITAIGTESAPPDLIHLMMKMDFESSLAADATRLGEKQLTQLLDAVDRLQIPNLTYRVTNNVVTPIAGRFPGFVYTRNIVFTLAPAQAEPSRAEVDRLVAQLEDLGARYNSHCVTCIGSG